jgi:uncharacterized protein YbjT (DUF2867 family)
MLGEIAVIAVVGAGGKTGRAVVNRLRSRSKPVRPLVRRPSGLDGEVVVDLLDSFSVRAALEGVDTVYHMAPNMHTAEFEIGRRVITIAPDAGVKRIVYHSVLHPQLESMPHHWDKLRVEEALMNSRLRWTILQPAPYAQNFTRPPDGVLRIAYRTDAPFSFVDLMDVADAAAIVLSVGDFDYGTYELAGPAVMTVADIAQQLGVRLECVDPQVWGREALARGMSPQAVTRLKSMFEHYDAHGLVGNPAALATILGRPPTNALDALLRDLSAQP